MLNFLTAGESHGRALVGILEGFPKGVRVSEDFINKELERRQSGFGRGPRMKIEKDQVEILSGLRGGKTLGSPIAFLIRNDDKYWFGALLRRGGVFGLNFGLTLAESLILNYSYEFSAKGILSKSDGTHEFSIGYFIYFQPKEPISRKWRPRYPYIID